MSLCVDYLIFWGLWRCVCLFFFFSSRRRHTIFDCDWSSDVCSSNLSFVASYLHDAHSRVRLLGLDGRFVKDVELPTLGSITQITGERQDDEMFFGFTSFLYPTTIFRYDFATGDTSVFKVPSIDFDPTQYETRQVFYTSKDGTRVPMFITHRKGLKLDGSNPTYLYGYGGVKLHPPPHLSVGTPLWVAVGGGGGRPGPLGGRGDGGGGGPRGGARPTH